MNQLQRSIKIDPEDLQSANLHDETYIEIQDGWVTLRELISATQNFSPDKEIGRGCFGVTYKAELQDFQVVAVKKLKFRPELNLNMTRNEIESLKLLNHENVVQLLDFYSSPNLTFLVYEYISGGSLNEALHGHSNFMLNWKTRFEICLGIAKGLMYLNSKSVVHDNIKSSDILLTETLVPKISNQFMLSGCKDSEHVQKNDTVEKKDVYSYGILLLEIVSGKEVTQYQENDNSVFLLDKLLNCRNITGFGFTCQGKISGLGRWKTAEL
ncbi:probable LRR receptor-like serine/threonine-protein kinase At1g07650 isoform X2 [Mercurialis annua]|uniref:probable LRR receptor-like serine/threonine-protein kinase At1g07650 isoform X2 n=1 Tax=Mercurialis annua TaxID=3986 RepID=UPI00216094E1|nr:probable LRR receptor-like serine/threonine-protein kinase At1g07650 isoform X2 [Mercurialis annua]